jgi:hypothetical protein
VPRDDTKFYEAHQISLYRLTASQGEKATDTRARDLIALLVRANTAANPQERLSDEAVLSRE